jgi:hypothetical protein
MMTSAIMLANLPHTAGFTTCEAGQTLAPVTLTYADSGATHNGNGLYHGSVLANDGRVYMVPYATKFVRVVDPANVAGVPPAAGSSREYGLNVNLDDQATYFVSGLLAPDGRIWMTPSRQFYKKMGVLDPMGLQSGSSSVQTRTLYTGIDIDWGSTDLAFCDAVLAHNGRIYMIPRHADVIGRFDLATNTFQTIDISTTSVNAAGQSVSDDEHLDDPQRRHRSGRVHHACGQTRELFRARMNRELPHRDPPSWGPALPFWPPEAPFVWCTCARPCVLLTDGISMHGGRAPTSSRAASSRPTVA